MDIEGGAKNKKESSEKENIFDLTKLIPMENEEELKKQVTTITSSDQERLLKGYVEAPSDEWEKFALNTHVRYLRKDGSFRRGGFVKNIWVGSIGKNTGKKTMQLASSLSFKSTKWTIVLDDIDKIWKKNTTYDNSQQSESTADVGELKITMTANTEAIEYLTKTVDQIKVDIAKINNEQQRIVNLIKKLHGIRSRSSR